MENKIFLGGILSITTILILIFSSVKPSNPVEERLPAGKAPVVENRIKVAIIDTGINVNTYNKKFLCKRGHKSFIYGQKALEDAHGHGTNIASLIIPHMDNKTHCLVILKFWDKNMSGSGMELVRLSLLEVEKLGASYVNLSLTGNSPDHLEYVYISRLIKKGVKFSVAAGNDYIDLDKGCNAYPACYKITSDNFKVVGSSHSGTRLRKRTAKVLMPGKKVKPVKPDPRVVRVYQMDGKWYEEYLYSNYGSRINRLENGTNQGNPVMTGTSQATAINTGKWIKEDRLGTH